MGTVGLPGERTFYLQAMSGTTVHSVRLEKEQAELLGEKTDELLDMVRARSDAPSTIPVVADPARADNAGLTMPVDAEFRVGTMSLSWDTTAGHLVVECFEVAESEPEDGEEDDRARLRVVLDAQSAREFARRAEQVVNAGREDCPYCSLPLDPEGHVCPRLNGVAR